MAAAWRNLLVAKPYRARGSGHAVFIESGSVTVANLRLSGSGGLAALCVTGTATLRMVGCSVVDYSGGGGLLVHGGSALLQGCTFLRCNGAAVEVRQGGSLSAVDTRIEECRQGVSAYGGARDVRLRGCVVLRCSNEGIVAAGSSENAATAAQAALLPQLTQNPSKDPSTRRVTERGGAGVGQAAAGRAAVDADRVRSVAQRVVWHVAGQRLPRHHHPVPPGGQ